VFFSNVLLELGDLQVGRLSEAAFFFNMHLVLLELGDCKLGCVYF
jgi:hypothetical protein